MSRRNYSHRSLLALACALVAELPAQSLAVPEFVPGDLASLTARVVDARAVDDVFQLLTVEVQNRADVAAEPLAFAVELPGKKSQPARSETFARVQLPQLLRFGRPVPPGGKQRYPVTTALPGKKAQFTLRVVDASWYRDGVVAAPAVEAGAPTQVQRTSLAGAFPVTRIPLRNPYPFDLDVLFEARFREPRDTVELLGARLKANGTLDWIVSSRPGNHPFVESDGPPGCAIKVATLTVVDWSLCAPHPRELGADVLRAPYEAWYRWPESRPVLGGDFAFRERRQRAGAPDQYDAFAVGGRFTVGADGKVAVAITSGDGANAGLAIGEAIGNLRRPDFAALAASNELEVVASDRVRLRGPGWSGAGGASTVTSAGEQGRVFDDLEMRGGRIVSEGNRDDARTRWETAEVAGGYVVTRRVGASIDARYAYAEHDGRVWPTSLVSTTKFGEQVFSTCELVLSNLHFDGIEPIATARAGGAGADALRAIWQHGHHHPTEPLEWTAQVDVENAGDGVWQGFAKLRGSLRARGFGRTMRDLVIDFDQAVPEQLRFQMAAVVYDRFGIWIGRDFGDRPDFDAFCHGAVVGAADATGTFALTGGPVDEVFTANGLVTGWRRGTTTTKFTWKAFGDVQAVVRIDEAFAGAKSQDRWTSAVDVTLTRVGERLLPTAFRCERIFGRDWGPETVTLKKVVVH